MKTLLKSIAFASAVSFAAGASAAPFVLDTFDDAVSQAVGYTNIGAQVLYDAKATTSAYGGWRELSILALVPNPNTGQSCPPISTCFIDPSLEVSLGQLRWSNGSASSIAKVRYDGGGAGNDFLLGIDLTGLSATETFVVQSDAQFPFTLRLFTSGTQYTSLTFPSNPQLPPGMNHYIPLTAFTSIFATQFGGGVDFTDVNAIEIEFTAVDFSSSTPSNADVRLDRIAVVPEPGSLALVGLALLGLTGMRRLKSKQ